MTSYTDKELRSLARGQIDQVTRHEGRPFISVSGRQARSRVLFDGFTLRLRNDGIRSFQTLIARGTWNDTGEAVTVNIAI